MVPLDKIRAVDEMQKYIEAHLTEEITLHALTECTAYSPWHASRIFKEITGLTPFEYIRKLRLSNAAVDMWDESRRVVDIALNYVFDSHDGFTRAFARQFGLTPSRYKKHTPLLPLFKPNSVRDHYRYLQGNDPIECGSELPENYFVQVMEFPKRKLIYMPCAAEAADYFTYVEAVGCDIWGLLCSVKEALYEPVGLWFPEELRPEGCSEYVQGVEVPEDFAGELPGDLRCMELEPCSMLVFQGLPFENERYEEAIMHLRSEIDAYAPELYGYMWDDASAPKIQLEPQGYRGYIEARPVRHSFFTPETNI